MIDYKNTLNQSIQRKKKLLMRKFHFIMRFHSLVGLKLVLLMHAIESVNFVQKLMRKLSDTYNKMDLKLIEKLKKEFEIIGFDKQSFLLVTVNHY